MRSLLVRSAVHDVAPQGSRPRRGRRRLDRVDVAACVRWPSPCPATSHPADPPPSRPGRLQCRRATRCRSLPATRTPSQPSRGRLTVRALASPPVRLRVGADRRHPLLPALFAGKKLLSSSADSTLIQWDPKTGSSLQTFRPEDGRFALENGITALAVHPSSNLAVAGGSEGGIRVVNLIKGEVVAAFQGHKEGESVESVRFIDIAGNGVVVSAGTDGKACVWDVTTGRLRSTLDHQEVRRPSHVLQPERAHTRDRWLTVLFPPALARRTPSRRSTCTCRPKRTSSRRRRSTRHSRRGTSAMARSSASTLATATSSMRLPSAAAATARAPSSAAATTA